MSPSSSEMSAERHTKAVPPVFCRRARSSSGVRERFLAASGTAPDTVMLRPSASVAVSSVGFPAATRQVKSTVSGRFSAPFS